MAIDVIVPALGESITEATVGEWLKAPGEVVKADEAIVSLETDKVAVEVPAPAAGVLAEQLFMAGDTVSVGAVIARIEAQGAAGAKAAPATAPAAPAQASKAPAKMAEKHSPAVTVALAETGRDASTIVGTGKDGRLTKADVRNAPAPATAPVPVSLAAASGLGRNEERVRMTRIRQTIARRLKEAQNTAAMLTTFNDVDMSAVMDARERYKDSFEKKHGVKLGFMSFFTKACCLALKDVPAVNAAIDGDEIVYRDYADIGIAVSSPGGLVVPILRDADKLSFAETEKAIGDFGRRARDGQLKLEEMQGGTFTISNGGVFGSLLSTPILNPPQSGVLGMHRIEERPVVRGGQIVVRPMMYLALSYDHRLIDGREAVTFLVRVKEAIEDPTRLVLDL
jgi:2-oxoglutarate dehydrogenase E2 component (dihydrolipoamide succinyltransferase)